MLFTIIGKHIDIPVAVKNYAEEKTSKLPSLYNLINQAEVIIDSKAVLYGGLDLTPAVINELIMP